VILGSGRLPYPAAADGREEASMRLTWRMIVLQIAVVLFVLAVVGVDLGSLAIVPLGLAFFAGAFLVPDTVVGARG
jgi:hypothetical protein